MRKIEETEDKEDKSWGQEVMHKLWFLPSMLLALYRRCVPSPYVRASGKSLSRSGPQHGCSREKTVI